MRSVEEWIGKTDDTPAPPRVRLRVFERYEGVCHWSGRKIRPGDAWDADHVIAIINGGENRESNLAPILRGKSHKEKTAQDLAEKSKTYERRKKHLLGKKSKQPMRGWRKFNGERVFNPKLSRRTHPTGSGQ